MSLGFPAGCVIGLGLQGILYERRWDIVGSVSALLLSVAGAISGIFLMDAFGFNLIFLALFLSVLGAVLGWEIALRMHPLAARARHKRGKDR